MLGAYIYRGLVTLTATLLIAVGATTLILHATSQKLLSVQTQSMAPTFQKGDAILVAPALSKAIRPGEIVSYRSPSDPSVVVSHRLVAINKGQLVTAGDALGSRDQPFPADRLIGRAVAVAPHLGYVIDFMSSWLGLTLFVYLPALILLAAETRRLMLNYIHATPTTKARPT